MEPEKWTSEPVCTVPCISKRSDLGYPSFSSSHQSWARPSWWAKMQFLTTILTRQTFADCEASGRFYDLKLMQNNLTFPHNLLVKWIISHIYIIGVRGAESFQVRERWKCHKTSFISLRYISHLSRPFKINKNFDNSIRSGLQDVLFRSRKISHNIWLFIGL